MKKFLSSLVVILLSFTAVAQSTNTPRHDGVFFNPYTTATITPTFYVTEGHLRYNSDTGTLWSYEAGSMQNLFRSEKIAVTPAGNLVATDLQSALVELQTEIDASDLLASTNIWTGDNTFSNGIEWNASANGTPDVARFVVGGAVGEDFFDWDDLNSTKSMYVRFSGNYFYFDPSGTGEGLRYDFVNENWDFISDLPRSSGTPTIGSVLVNKTYVDNAVASGGTNVYTPIANEGLVAVTLQTAIDEVNQEAIFPITQTDYDALPTAEQTSRNWLVVDATGGGSSTFDASNLTVTPTGNLAAATGQAAFDELQGDVDAINTTLGTATLTDDQTATEVGFTATGNTTSTNVQAAIVELQTEIDGLGGGGTAASTTIADAGSLITATNVEDALQEIVTNLNAQTDDQTAAEVPFTATGNTTSTDVQAAIVELQTEIDGLGGGGFDTAANYVVTGGWDFSTGGTIIHSLSIDGPFGAGNWTVGQTLGENLALSSSTDAYVYGLPANGTPTIDQDIVTKSYVDDVTVNPTSVVVTGDITASAANTYYVSRSATENYTVTIPSGLGNVNDVIYLRQEVDGGRMIPAAGAGVTIPNFFQTNATAGSFIRLRQTQTDIWQIESNSAVFDVQGLAQLPPVVGTQYASADEAIAVPDYPTTVATGEVLVAMISFGSEGTITVPSGWTEIWQDNSVGTGMSASTPLTSGLFYRIADGTEGGTTQTFNTSSVDAAGEIFAVMMLFPDTDGAAVPPYESLVTEVPDSNGVNWTQQQVTSSANGGLHVDFLFVEDNNDVASSPLNMTKQFHVSTFQGSDLGFIVFTDNLQDGDTSTTGDYNFATGQGGALISLVLYYE